MDYGMLSIDTEFFGAWLPSLLSPTRCDWELGCLSLPPPVLWAVEMASTPDREWPGQAPSPPMLFLHPYVH